jgi:hypothetical protein
MMPTQEQKADNWTKFAIFQLYGFFVAGKLFAYVAGPLVIAIIFNRRLCERIYKSLIGQNVLTYVCWILLISILDGIFGLVYGLLSGYSPVTALEIFVFNLCPIYLFLGIWAGERKHNLARIFVAFNAWYFTIFTFVYYAFFRNSLVVEHPGSGIGTLLGLFCFEFSLARYWFPILVLCFDFFAAQIRADWASLAVALSVWGSATRRLGRVMAIVVVLVAILAFGFVIDFRMPGLPGRGGEFSARDTIGRALSSFAPDVAQEYASDAQVYAGTVAWREKIWKAIREAVDEDYTTRVFGLGYGFPLPSLVPDLKGSDLRSPHSVFYFTLLYSGAAGVTIFFTLQAALMILLWRAYKATGQIYGVVLQITLLTAAFFGNYYEAPQAAIPSYLLLGMCIGPMFSQSRQSDEDDIGYPDAYARPSIPKSKTLISEVVTLPLGQRRPPDRVEVSHIPE